MDKKALISHLEDKSWSKSGIMEHHYEKEGVKGYVYVNPETNEDSYIVESLAEPSAPWARITSIAQFENDLNSLQEQAPSPSTYNYMSM